MEAAPPENAQCSRVLTHIDVSSLTRHRVRRDDSVERESPLKISLKSPKTDAWVHCDPRHHHLVCDPTCLLRAQGNAIARWQRKTTDLGCRFRDRGVTTMMLMEFRSFVACARYGAIVLACSALLQGCGGGGSAGASTQDSQAATPSTPAVPAVNHAPTISGTPPLSVQAGQPYTFAPTASDADGDALTFSITNKPSWATFSTSTGKLTGTPPASGVGSFTGVIITVSDGKDSASLAPYTIAVSAAPASGSGTGSATLSWTPPTTHSDGSALNDLAEYRVKYGTAEGDYSQVITVQNPGIASYVVDGLSAGTYFFVVTAVDSQGTESPASQSVSKTIS